MDDAPLSARPRLPLHLRDDFLTLYHTPWQHPAVYVSFARLLAAHYPQADWLWLETTARLELRALVVGAYPDEVGEAYGAAIDRYVNPLSGCLSSAATLTLLDSFEESVGVVPLPSEPSVARRFIGGV